MTSQCFHEASLEQLANHTTFHFSPQKGIMNVNKKLDRFKQWAGERMGGEVKTNVSDDFKSLEVEMTLRHEG